MGYLSRYLFLLETYLSEAQEERFISNQKQTLTSPLTFLSRVRLEEEIIKLQKSNIKYLDITSFTYDSNLKRIKDEYFSRYDHHNLNRNIYFNKIIDEYLLNSAF